MFLYYKLDWRLTSMFKKVNISRYY